MEKLLKLLETNPTLSAEQLAVMLDTDPARVARQIDQATRNGIIKGYRAIIDWEKTGTAMVKALIELKVTPKKGRGFDEIAMAIASMDEVEGVTLMSGGYDLLVEIKAKSFQDIAMFVFRRLSPMDDVNETATHFVLRPYKQNGIIFHDEEEDERGFNSL